MSIADEFSAIGEVQLAAVPEEVEQVFANDSMIGNNKIRSVGFFHFVKDYERPLEALRNEIDRCGPSKVSEALIVLPEAFNLGSDYWAQDPRSPDEAILDKLLRVCRDFNVSFVAGAILKTFAGPTPPYSSAYRVDSTGFQALCRKRSGDGRHESPRDGYAPHYTCCQEDEDCYRYNAKPYKNVLLTALICLDADPYHGTNSARQGRLRNRMKESGGGVVPQIVCIPSHMRERRDPHEIAKAWPNSYVVLANSFHEHSPLSFVARVGKGNPGSAPVEMPEKVTFQEWGNIVKVAKIEAAS